MEYINPTTATLAAAGAGAGAYYVYSNVIEPQQRQHRAKLAEQAKEELLGEHANQLKRGSNKQQAKKKLSMLQTTGRFKKGALEKEGEEEEEEAVDERMVTISNPWDILKEDASQSPLTPLPTHKKSSKKAVAAAAATTTGKKALVEVEKSVKFKTAEVKEPMAAVEKVDVEELQFKELPKAVLRKSKQAKKEAAAAAAAVAAAVADAAAAANAAAAAQATVASDSTTATESIKLSKKSESSKAQKSSQAEKKTVASTAPAVAPVEATVPNQEFEALRTLLQHKELAAANAEARAAKMQTQVQELEKQLAANADVVKAAKRTESRAQNTESKIESLNYTNTLLVRQLSAEKEVTKDALNKCHRLTIESLQQSATLTAPLEAKIRSLEKERMEMEQEMSSRLADLNRDLQFQRHHAEENATLLSRRLKETEERLETAVRERNEVRRNVADVLTDKETRISDLEQEIAAMEGELETAKLRVEESVEAAVQAKEVSHSKMGAFLEEIDQLKAQLKAKDQEHDLVKGTVEEEKKKKEAVADDKVKVEEALKKAVEEKEKVEAELDALVEASRVQKGEAQVEQEALQARVYALESELIQVREQQQQQQQVLSEEKKEEEVEVVDYPKCELGREEPETEIVTEVYNLEEREGVAVATF